MMMVWYFQLQRRRCLRIVGSRTSYGMVPMTDQILLLNEDQSAYVFRLKDIKSVRS